MAAPLWKQAFLLEHQLPCRDWDVVDAHVLHWWQEICPEHILHAAFAVCVIRLCMQKMLGVCRLGARTFMQRYAARGKGWRRERKLDRERSA